MKKLLNKYNLIVLFGLAFVIYNFNVKSGDAYYDSGCTGAGPYSITTGRYCDSGPSSNNNGYYNYPTPYNSYTTPYNQNIGLQYTFSRELGIGSRGQDVMVLQQILVNTGYLYGQVDGIYGYLTTNAVIGFQLSHGLIGSGRADFSTLASLSSASASTNCVITIINGIPNNVCGGGGGYYSYPTPYNSYTTPYSTPYVTPYPYYYQTPYGNSSAPTIRDVNGPTSLDTYEQGSWTVSAYSQNGSYLSYYVDWDDDSNNNPYNSNNSSNNNSNQSATFYHAYSHTGTYHPTFTVRDQNGRSDDSSITVRVSGSNNNNDNPTINYLSPNSGQEGDTITIYGDSFTSSGNDIRFANTTISNLRSYSNGTRIDFDIPRISNSFNCFSYPCYENVDVYVTNDEGNRSNTMTFSYRH